MQRLVLGIAVAVTSLMPVVGLADDQQIADFIKSRLTSAQQQGSLQGFSVDMRVENGTVWFSGTVANADQELLILTAAQKAGHLGVTQVVDEIEIGQAQAAYAPEANQPIPAATPEFVEPARHVGYQQQVAAPQRRISAYPVSNRTFAAPPAAPSEVAPPTFVSPPIAAPATIVGNEPLAINSPYAAGLGPAPAGYGGPSAAGGSPSLPGYAWPSYAAHPNFGNVSYPQQYSASAWPYIGPFYPYPQVPLGWRKVTLEWDDGFWMLDFHDK